ncbi:Beta-amyrin 28-monooxygenase, partial [Camellia lanceoleosa]
AERVKAEKFLHDRMERHCPDIFRTSLFGDSKMTFFCGPTAWWPKSFNKIFLSEGASALNSLATSSASVQVQESKRVRNLISGFLKLDAIQKYIPVMDTVAKHHIENEWAPKGDNVVVIDMAKKFTFELACQLLLNVTDSKQVAKFDNRFRNVIAGMMSVPIDFPGTSFNRATKDRKMAVQQKNKDSIIIRDLLSHLLVTPDEDGKLMNDVEIADKIVGQLIAGYDTASTTITFILKYLAEHPHFYDEVFKEQMEIAKSKEPGQSLNWRDIQQMRYTWHVACEAMRLAPPAPLAFKEALTDFTFAGFTIPKGWKTCWSVHSTHKNPAFFPNPEKFDPPRFEGDGPLPFTFVLFGGRPRMCPGKEYARLVILVFMHNLVTRFKWIKLIPNDKIIFKPVPFLEGGLPICLHPHKN